MTPDDTDGAGRDVVEGRARSVGGGAAPPPPASSSSPTAGGVAAAECVVVDVALREEGEVTVTVTVVTVVTVTVVVVGSFFLVRNAVMERYASR